MSDLKAIKKAIYDDERIEELLELMGCDNIQQRNGLYTARRPGGSNSRSVQVRNDKNLKSDIRSQQVTGDIYALVSYIINNCETESERNDDLYNSKMWIVKKLGYEHILRKNKNPEPEKPQLNRWLDDLRKMRGKKKRKRIEDITENEVIKESVKNQYIMKPYYGWYQEGISIEAQHEFEIGFDLQSKRVVAMIRNTDGQLIGVKGRTVLKDEEEDRKYFYLYSCNKSLMLYNQHRALPYIKEKKEVIVVEGFKTVFKLWDMGIYNAVSIEGDIISDDQVALLKGLGLDINIILAFDKDKSKLDIGEQAEKITNRCLYAIFDEDDLLTGKDSPTDKGADIWFELYSSRVIIPVENNLALV